MDLILAVDAITRPLTGIARYAFELARTLPEHPQIDSIRYYSWGRWASLQSLQSLASVDADAPRGGLRTALARNRVAVRLFQGIMPQVSRWRLRDEGSALFHSPNYFLPPVAGRSIATVHDLSHVRCPTFHPAARVAYMHRAFPESLRLADHLITDTEVIRQEVIGYFGWPPDRITVVPLGVDPQFHPRHPHELLPMLQKVGLNPGNYTLCVSTIEPRKNIDRLLTVYEELSGSLQMHYPLVLAGARGWRSELTHDRIRKAESAGWLRYLEFVPQRDLPLLYAGARLFVYPSLYEGFGLPVLEAMASGVPVVTSNVSSMPEVAGDAARLVNPEDSDSLLTTIAQALQDDTWLKRAKTLGLSRASIFTWQSCVEQTICVYQKVINDQAHCRRAMHYL